VTVVSLTLYVMVDGFGSSHAAHSHINLITVYYTLYSIGISAIARTHYSVLTSVENKPRTRSFSKRTKCLLRRPVGIEGGCVFDWVLLFFIRAL